MKNLIKFVNASKFALAFAATSGVLLLSVPAQAGVCEQKGAQIAASQGAQLLGAQSKGDTCQIRLLVKSKKGPPKRKTVIVQK